MPLFSETLRQLLDAQTGAYSPVTKREAEGDKAVTVDRHERQVLANLYNLHELERGSGKSDNAYREFLLVNFVSEKLSRIRLALKFPKRTGNELRLYFNRESGFHPAEDEVWFLYQRTDYSHALIGSLPPDLWAALETQSPESLTFFRTQIRERAGTRRTRSTTMNASRVRHVDFRSQETAGTEKEPRPPLVPQNTGSSGSLSDYRERISTRPGIPHERSTQAFLYNTGEPMYLTGQTKEMVEEALSRSSCRCEVDPSHSTFTTALTGKPYVEVFDLFATAFSFRNVETSQPDPNNNSLPVVLCPACRLCLSYGKKYEKAGILDALERRTRDVAHRQVSYMDFQDLYRWYGVEDTPTDFNFRESDSRIMSAEDLDEQP